MNPQTDTPESAEAMKWAQEAAQEMASKYYTQQGDYAPKSLDSSTFAAFFIADFAPIICKHAQQSNTAVGSAALTDANAALSMKLQRCEEALAQSENTLRSLIGTLQTVDSDDRYRARQERREPLLHTMEIKQAEQCRKQIEAALTHPTRNEGEKKV